jgi:hypothetical protein
MPKYRARITETLYRVAYVIVEADDEEAAWAKADTAMWDIKDDDFICTDGDMEVSDVEELKVTERTANV